MLTIPLSLVHRAHKPTNQPTNHPSYKARIAVDWAPDLDPPLVLERLMRAKAAYPKKAVATFCPLPLPGMRLGVVWGGGRCSAVCALNRCGLMIQQNKISFFLLQGTEENPDGPEPRLPRRLWARLVAGAGLGGGEDEGPSAAAAVTWGQASPKALDLLAERLKGSVYDTTGKGAFKVGP